MRKIADYLTKDRSGKDKKNRPKHTRKRIHQTKKNFLEKFKTVKQAPYKICCKSEEQAKKICKSFAYLKKSLYLCTRFKKTMINIAEWSSW
ncbi:hypothetical protein B5F78_00370 [Bacteroides sp. An279]|nr:hypothetical protein B5F78_00370 [Bacteroides sp. An279]